MCDQLPRKLGFTVGVECLDAFAEIIRAAQAAIGLAFELDG